VEIGPVEIALMAGVSLLGALAALWLAARLPAWPRPAVSPHGDDTTEETVLLFDGAGALVDATPSARQLLETVEAAGDGAPAAAAAGSAFAAFLGRLAPRFPDLPSRLDRLDAEGRVSADSLDGAARLRLARLGEVTRLALVDLPGQVAEGIDRQSLAALEADLALMRRIVAGMPVLAWQQDDCGRVIWANRAYLEALAGAGGVSPEALVWPLAPVFDEAALRGILREGGTRRLAVTGPGGGRNWFDCSLLPGAAPGAAPLLIALPADPAVRAEAALGDFVQTLSKTFAALPTGLVVFNRARELVMFNPALCALLGLEPEFLTPRPTLAAFLDRLRDRGMIPEQKNYAEWRARMAALEQAAAAGEVEERWALPSGRVFKVTGQPHPDGAVAFLFEDVTSEVASSRRHRAEIEAAQGALDSLDEAVAVFSPEGVLTLSNRAYARLWGNDPSTTLGEVSIRDSLELWHAAGLEAAALARIRAAVAAAGQGSQMPPQPHRLGDGRMLSLRLAAIGGGFTLVGFSPVAEADNALPRHELAG